MALAGLAVRAWAAGQLQKDKALTVSGPYAHTRNPLYLGSFLIGLGVTLAGGVWGFVALFLAFFLIVYRRTMERESAKLELHFGEAFVRYREAVPLFVPRSTPYRPAAELGQTPTRFSLDRYLRNKEWEAALGAVAGFAFLALRAFGAF
ncbi:MAG: isoprenylcysteine carboxylmethyltransferase family protein [Gemmatimonadetes bacterium]|nr:isoprenylcysteine carboxylmethyltransferase family protein [Gemmatimonadota bacterium]